VVQCQIKVSSLACVLRFQETAKIRRSISLIELESIGLKQRIKAPIIAQKCGLKSELSMKVRAPKFLNLPPKDIGFWSKILWVECSEYNPLKLSQYRRSPCMGGGRRRKAPGEAIFKVCDISVSEFADSVPQADHFGLFGLSI
jgi:hypothetical protein